MNLLSILHRILFLLLATVLMPSWSNATETAAERIRSTVEFMASVGSRISGYPGSERATDYIADTFTELGLEGVTRDQFEVTVPVDKGSELIIEDTGERILLKGLWPNLVRTTTTAPEGLVAPLIYGGDGSFGALDDKAVEGSIVLMEFNTWNLWLNAASLGAAGFIFIEPEATSWRQADSKYVLAPLDVPRFWIEREAGERLRRDLDRGELTVRLKSRMDWERHPTWNIWGKISGTDPLLKDETIVVEAYYDGMSVVPSLAPAAEMASSIATLLEVARHLKVDPPARSVILVATAAHFQDQRGMVDFLDRHARKLKHYAQFMELPLDPKLFISLDLSSQTDRLGIWNNTYSYDLKRFFVPFGRRFTTYADEVAPTLGREGIDALVNGISPIKGMDWGTFVPEGISVNSIRAMAAGLVSLAFVTVNDGRFGIDTPLDKPEKVKYDNLERQVTFLNGILTKAFNDPAFFEGLEDFDPVLKDRLRSMRAKVRAYPRRSTKADRPLPGAIVTLWGIGAEKNFYFLGKSHKGVRRTQYHLTDAKGEVEIPGLYLGGQGVSAYLINNKNGQIVYAPDLAKRAQGEHGAPGKDGWLSQSIRWNTHEKVLVLFPSISRPFFGLIDPQSLTMLRDIKIIDRGGRDAEQFGFTIGLGLDEPVGVLFGPNERGRDNAIKMLVGSRMMLLNSRGSDSEQEAKGEGFELANDTLLPTPLLAVQDMWNLNQARLNTMRKHAIENQRLSRLHQRAEMHIEKANDAWDEKSWTRYIAHTRAALGLTARAYPDAKGTLNDVIRGMVFFLALVIPAAFFAERLIFSAADIRKQLLGFSGLLLIIWIIISQIHPAFEIAHPMVILLGFAIMVMSCLVLSLLSSRFNAFMRQHKAKTAHIHETDISRASAAYTAFMLGISNMRRRLMRTGLTLVTLTLLTFTVLSFTSFREQIRFMAFPLTHSGDYEGVLVRGRGWWSLFPPVLDYVRSHFDQEATISPRNWYISFDVEEGKKYIEVALQGKSYKSTGLLGLTPLEPSITGIDRSLVAGSFFAEDYEETCLISTQMAEHLGISEFDVGKSKVQVFGRDLLVRGIFDPVAFEAIRDLDNEPLTPVDFQMSSSDALGGGNIVDTQASKEAESFEIRPFVHLDAENVFIMPYDILREAGGELYSIGIRFNEGVVVLDAIERFLTRITISLFAGIHNPDDNIIDVFSYTSLHSPSVEGLGALMVPMVIAAMIVLNAMLGAVYERFREIGIYSSVGLAPMHIALLFVAEACVYAVLGVTLGYILGQGLGKVLIAFDMVQGMNLNYSSMSAMISAGIVMLVVLLSTIYPARIAERTAVPGMVRRWSPPEPEGDRWVFDFPFMISEAEVLGTCGFLANFFNAYSEESIGQFYADKVQVVREDNETGKEYAVRMLLWMAPFDMGVSQYMQLEFVPASIPGAYIIEVFIQRISGQDTFWQRVNHRFMNELRKEFLIFNTLDAESKAFHRQTAEDMLIEIPEEKKMG